MFIDFLFSLFLFFDTKILLSPSLSDDIRDKRTPPTIIETPAINDDDDDDDDENDMEDEIDSEVVLRPNRLNTAVTSNEQAMLSGVVNKRLQLDSPYFTQRPASENDIFTISTPPRSTLPSVSSTSDVNRFSMTPEVPSIAFVHLPKNYLDTPTIEKFKKQELTLAELQARENEVRKSEIDFSMPRYYGKSDVILNSSNLSISSVVSATSLARKQVEKSKRLKQLRAHIPPLTIHKDKHEKEK